MANKFIFQITDTHLKVARFQPSGGIDFQAEVIPPDADEKSIAERLARLLNKLEYRNNPLIIALPRSKVTCRYLKIPAQSPKEIEKIVSLQASRYLPYPQEELITGYEVISVGKDGYSNINLVIAQKDVINRYLGVCKGLNCPSLTIALSSYGLSNIFNQVYPEPKNAEMLIDIDSSQMELAVIAHGKLLFSRYFKVDMSNPGWKSIFLDEVLKSREAYKKEVAGEAADKILVTGQQNLADDLIQALNAQAGIKAEALPYRKISADTSFISLIGLGIKDVAYSLNLLPKDLKEELIVRAQKKEYAQLLLFAAVIIAVLGLGVAKSLDNKAQYLKKLKAELDKVSQQAKPLKEIEKRLTIASGSLKEKPSSLEVFSEIHRLIPASILLTEFIYEAGRDLTLRGQAQDLGAVFALVSQIENSSVLKSFSVKVRYATKRKTSAGEVIGFEIVCAKI
jgi:Tfp pilus assembly protein PilN